ncbi:glycosyltransferase family 4 protein [Azovibrio restrictus]|uniref:glycosyltransferase family 4 protein n=1 Tax=Azovibrio restrictus TaxID=146938 RepID=UPI00040B5968|nr:glycosyltransferase family 1 protein [Azovibrio restrictus]
MSNDSILLWVDVTTLMHWQRPAVGIVRVEQQFCLWLLAEQLPDVGFCGYDKSSRSFYAVSREQLQAQLDRIQAIGTRQNEAVPSGDWKLHLKHRLKQAIGYLPPALGVRVFNLLQRLRPHAGRLWRGLVVARGRLAAARRKEEGGVPRAFTPVQFAPGSVYVSMGLDWDYKDMADIYRQKQERGFKCLFFCYDIIPVLMPQLCVADVSRQFAHYFADLAWAADRILCISDASRRDLLQLLDTLGVPCASAERVHLGGDILPEGGLQAPSPTVEKVLAEPFILFVSTIERRKNHETLYRAYSRLARQGVALPRLVFVGMSGWGVQELFSDLRLDPMVAGKIELLHHVDDADLAVLYQHAQFTVYPSLYEGWGLPVAESLAFGKYCLASNAASLPEVGGDWVDYLDPWDVPGWAERLQFLFAHPEWVAERNARIAREYRAHPWRETAREIYEQARALASSSPGQN